MLTFEIKPCKFCERHDAGDTLFEFDDIFDDYNRIPNIQFCPLCGSKLAEYKTNTAVGSFGHNDYLYSKTTKEDTDAQ